MEESAKTENRTENWSVENKNEKNKRRQKILGIQNCKPEKIKKKLKTKEIK